jgi:BirA family biotin operon repressor/biotin-[acetyl-CoA-carboxylase] ligase
MALGFGVNVHASPPAEVAPRATSAAAHAAAPVTRLEILGAALRSYDALLARLYDGDADGVWREWRRSLGTLGRPVRVRGPGGALEGVALDVARDGALLLETEPGAPPRAVYAGDAIEEGARGAGREA